MSAVVLREAAALMRERAEAARTFSDAKTGAPLPWVASPHGDVHGSAGDWMCDSASGETAEHIASWHPAVALAVADWLELSAFTFESRQQAMRQGVGTFISGPNPYAVAAARAYLGSAS